MEVGAPDNRIEGSRPDPDAPALRPQCRYLDSVITARRQITTNAIFFQGKFGMFSSQ
jgi:hypothetical protein